MKEFCMSKSSPVVQTPKGKLRGFRYDGVDHFHGIRYAKAKRFQMPEPVAPWEGGKERGQLRDDLPGALRAHAHRRGDDPPPVLAQLGTLPVPERLDRRL